MRGRGRGRGFGRGRDFSGRGMGRGRGREAEPIVLPKGYICYRCGQQVSKPKAAGSASPPLNLFELLPPCIYIVQCCRRFCYHHLMFIARKIAANVKSSQDC